ncbi:hypothetical protein HYPSUDRAFT_70941 [Hypholoma sublateritium FD-334 SS-4]|uniref:Uncharacterized protein n=1 Tax=Hypholoma sublateritium (strain FD-334 SS-4) TaxID=945553 RepID=A0A0D2KR66_HYPSF|nr:hypothetical protein HYPSUDRAFT_70941 [Hypholoma sublateritium FD-334 SS-4]
MSPAAGMKKGGRLKDPDKCTLLNAVGIIENKCHEIEAAKRDLASAFNRPGSPRDLELETALDELSGVVRIAARAPAISAIPILYDNLEDYHSILRDLQHSLTREPASVTIFSDLKSRIHCRVEEFKRMISPSPTEGSIPSMSMFQNARHIFISGGSFNQISQNHEVREQIDSLRRLSYLQLSLQVTVLFV